MVLIDQRNHGASASLPVTAPHDIPAAAKDLADLLKANGWDMPNVMIAHSLGGKVVLDFLQNAAAGSYGSVVLPKQVIRLLRSPFLTQLSIEFTCLYVSLDAKTIHTNMKRFLVVLYQTQTKATQVRVYLYLRDVSSKPAPSSAMQGHILPLT